MTKVLAQLNIATALAPLDSPHKPLMYFGGLTQITPQQLPKQKKSSNTFEHMVKAK